MSVNQKCEAFDGSKWRSAQIIKVSPKTENYPDGGFYVQWLDIDVNDPRQSAGGWKTRKCVRCICVIAGNHQDIQS